MTANVIILETVMAPLIKYAPVMQRIAQYFLKVVCFFLFVIKFALKVLLQEAASSRIVFALLDPS